MASNDKYPNSQSLILCAIEIYQLHESIKHYLINQKNLQNELGFSGLVFGSHRSQFPGNFHSSGFGESGNGNLSFLGDRRN